MISHYTILTKLNSALDQIKKTQKEKLFHTNFQSKENLKNQHLKLWLFNWDQTTNTIDNRKDIHERGDPRMLLYCS